MVDNITKGIIGENKAADYITSKGYRIISRNYRCKIGEIDIIAIKDHILVFIEVKTRSSNRYGYPYEAVNWKKQNKIIKTSMVYMREKRLLDYQMRYDIIEIYLKGEGRINHIENAFS